MREQQPNLKERSEAATEVNRDEVINGWSYSWWRTVQEVLPGKLRDAPARELSREEKELYRSAYKILNSMVSAGQVEVTFREEDVEKESSEVIHAKKNRPQFRLSEQKGKRPPHNDWEGDLVRET